MFFGATGNPIIKWQLLFLLRLQVYAFSTVTYVLFLTIVSHAWQALESFRKQEVDFLIATDVAARVSISDHFLWIDYLCQDWSRLWILRTRGHSFLKVFTAWNLFFTWSGGIKIAYSWLTWTVCLVTDFFHVFIQGLDIVGVETVINFHCPSDITV